MSESQFAIRQALEHEAPQMATVLYQSYRLLDYWPTCFPSVQEDNWVDSQTDFCLQHIGERSSLAFVATDARGRIVGVICGTFLSKTVALPTGKPIMGMDIEEARKMNNVPYHSTLTEKFGEFLCE